MADEARHRTRAELAAALPHIRNAPKDEGILELIVLRPRSGVRECPERAELSLENGVHGDHWIADGSGPPAHEPPNRDMQICMMMARCVEAIAGPRDNWAPAGDNLFIDIDMTPANMPPGTRLSVGSVELEITDEPHTACQGFSNRFGRDASVFVNTGEGRALSLRGLYARVLRDGSVTVGDRVRVLSRPDPG